MPCPGQRLGVEQDLGDLQWQARCGGLRQQRRGDAQAAQQRRPERRIVDALAAEREAGVQAVRSTAQILQGAADGAVVQALGGEAGVERLGRKVGGAGLGLQGHGRRAGAAELSLQQHGVSRTDLPLRLGEGNAQRFSGRQFARRRKAQVVPAQQAAAVLTQGAHKHAGQGHRRAGQGRAGLPQVIPGLRQARRGVARREHGRGVPDPLQAPGIRRQRHLAGSGLLAIQAGPLRVGGFAAGPVRGPLGQLRGVGALSAEAVRRGERRCAAAAEQFVVAIIEKVP